MQSECIVAALCFFSATSFGQAIDPTGPDTEYAICLEGQVGVRYYQSPILESPDGRWRAYASVEARRDRNVDCSNISSLQLQSAGEESFEMVHTIKPARYLQGNGLKLIAWSPRRHLLAVKTSFWNYLGDAGGNSLLVYDADRKRAIEPDIAKLFARKYRKKECAFDIRDVLGFDSHNRVLFRADDVIEPGDDEPIAETRCLGSRGVWALDIDHGQLEFVKHLEPEDTQ